MPRTHRAGSLPLRTGDDVGAADIRAAQRLGVGASRGDDMTTHNTQDSGTEPTVAGPQSEAAVAPSEVYAVAMPTVLSEGQRTLLIAVLDRIVPPRDGLPGAGGLSVDASIDRTLAMTPKLRRLVLDGLSEIALAAERVAGADFLALDAGAQEGVLRGVEAAEPAFFAALVEHTYRGYYTLPRVQAAVGYPDRPPQPHGHALAPFREELLQVQIKRAPFWRRAT
jgi:hypothetical protein